jgi:iron complex outermembrane receptor protein
MVLQRSHWLAGCSSLAVLLATTGAIAQSSEATTNTPNRTATDTDTGKTVGEVTVTARRRAEKLLDVPVAVTAFTQAALQTQNITSIQGLALATPGLSYDSTLGGSGRNDRSFPQYIIRGIVPSTVTNPTTTVFIDGAPVVSGQVEGIDDLARVEVLKGPQSAYFGRETFAGAINLVTKDPSGRPGGSVSVLAGSRDYYDVRASVEGPIIGDMLTARGTFRYYTKDGSWKNQAQGDSLGGTLGDQSTISGTAEVVFKPIENLKIKAFGSYFHDDDGASAQAFIGPDQANCLGGTWFCGVNPTPKSTTPAANTLIDAPTQAFLAAVSKNGLGAAPDKYGLKRDAYHASLGIDYYVPSLSLTLSSLTAGDYQNYGELQDLDNIDSSSVPNPFLAFASTPQYASSTYNNPFVVEGRYRDFSQEFRITSDSSKRFRYLVGVSYATSRADQSLAGGGDFGYFVYDAPTTDRNAGVFFGGTYDVFKQLSISVEGRYQSDRQTATGETRGFATAYKISSTFNDFTPRVIAQYHITSKVMAYVTYSEGVNPGTFNSSLSQLSPADLASLESTYGATVVVKPEHLKNYEVGLKGRFFDDTLTLSADAYIDHWTDQINVASVIYIEDGSTKLTTANLNNGRSTIQGVEGDIAWQPIRHLEFNVSGAINDTKITGGPCVTCSFYSGTTNVNGNQLPNVSKYQGAFGIQYGGSLVNGWDYFVRGDDYFKSGTYAAADNLVHTPDRNLINLRAGFTHQNFRIEGFVTNLTNNRSPTNLSTFYNVGSPFEGYAKPDALVAGLPDLRTFGVRLRYQFGG